MKVILKNIGVFKQAEYELGQLTIICGENNTGKTYATYSLYGFFDFWRYGYIYEINDSSITQLINSGSITISLPDNIIAVHLK
jgi:predicted ATPase